MKMMELYKTKINLLLAVALLMNSVVFAQKNFTKEADGAFENESYFSAIELYKKAEIKEKKPGEKARINYQIAECYRMMVEPAQAETFYNRALTLKYHLDHPCEPVGI